MIPRSIGIIGHGDFGQFLEMLVRRYVPDTEVRISSRRHEPDGVRFFLFEDTAACDVVIPAVSIRAFEETLDRILPHLRPDALILEVSTVKVHPVALLRAKANGIRFVATHPMFGPHSFRKQGDKLDGLRLVIADHTLPADEYAALVSWLNALKLDVRELTADAHDRLLAETLFLTHYVAQVVAKGGFVRTDIDSASFGYLMDAVESVKHDTELFKDVYRFNPYCAETIARFEESERAVRDLLIS